MRWPISAVAVLLVLGFTGCASGPRPVTAGNLEQLASLIDSGTVEQLSVASSVPFILDGELYYRVEDVSSLWQGLKAAGLKLSGGVEALSTPELVRPETYLVFSDAMDVKAFFANYVGPDVHLLTVSTNLGDFFLLVEPSRGGTVTIYGMKGPLQ